MKRQLPSRANLDQLKHQARDLLNAHRAGDEDALRRIRESHPRWSQAAEADVRAARFTLSGAQLVLAREYGFVSWPKLKEYVERALPQEKRPGRAAAGRPECRRFKLPLVACTAASFTFGLQGSI